MRISKSRMTLLRWIGGTLTYANGDQDKVIGVEEVAGKQVFLLEPINYRPYTDSFKSASYVKRMVRDGVWRLQLRDGTAIKPRVRIKDNLNPYSS